MNIPFGEVAVRCLSDDRFRAALLERPKAALQRAFDIEIPEGQTVKVVEDTEDTVHLIVPASENSRGAEVGIVATVLQRMRADDEFRRGVMARPREVFERATGVRIPDRPRFVVLEDTDRLTHIQIPARRPNRDLAATAQRAADESYGGDDGPYGGGEPPPESTGDDCTSLLGNNSSQAICCTTDVVNPASAWDCCFAEPSDPSGPRPPMMLPF